VRALVPGWIGIANIKWVGRIEVSETPLFSAWNTTQYRLFGDAYPDQPVLTTQTVKTAFELPFPATLHRGWHVITGRSWSAHGFIRRVEVSFDGGKFWRPAYVHPHLTEPQAWAQWSINWPAAPGEYVLNARAIDSRGNTQPVEVPFNLQGYLFSAVVSPVTVT
jgi:sulfane dehydrogenase subunit SoxC